MDFTTMQMVKRIFNDAGYDLSILEIKNMTKISSDTDDRTENVYAIYKKGLVHLVHIKENDSVMAKNRSISTKTLPLPEK